MRNYLKGVIYHVSLFLMLCILLGAGACTSPQLPAPTPPVPDDSLVLLPDQPISNNLKSTLHLIIIADTDDISIGQSTKIDLRNMRNLMAEIARQSLGSIVLKPLIRTKRVTQRELINILEHLRVQRNDIIIFHWAGHGHGSPGAKWPHLDTAAKTTDFRQVIRMLNSKHVRQFIALADCCNAPLINTRDRFAPRSLRQRYFFPKNIEKMFIRPAIRIVASGSESGQYASGTNSLGGYFTNNFITTLEETLSDQNIPDSAWENVMRTTRDRVIYDTRHKQKQTPQYEINPVNDWEPDDSNKGDVDEPDKKPVETGNAGGADKDISGTGNFDLLLDKIMRDIK